MNTKKLAAVLLLPLLLLTACGQNANKNESGRQESTMTVAYSDGGTTLDPAEANDVTSDTFVLAAYDQLVTYATKQENGKPTAKTEEIVPMLAEKFTASDDEKTYTFELRKDVKFHSGKVMTAQDVVRTFEHIRDSKSASFLYKMASIEKVTADGDHTAKIMLSEPNHLFLQILALYSFSIIDMDAVEGADFLARNTAGSGPYKVEEWDPAIGAKISVYPDYWGPKPAITAVNFKFINDASSRQTLLSKGEADLAQELPMKDIPALENTSGVVIDSRPSNKVLFFAMNNDMPPFDNVLVRRAVAYAIPYDKLLNDVMFGQAKRMKSAVASSTPGFTDEGYEYTYDLDKARALLAEAGMPGGFSFDFTLGSGFQDWNDDAVLIQAELAKIGVTMNIKNMARAQFLEALAGRNVQSYISRWTSFVNDPSYHLGLLMKTGTSSNYMNYSNAQVDNDLDQAAHEPDINKRNDLFRDAQMRISQDAPWAYLYEYNIVIGLRDNVQGYTSYPDGIVRYFQMSKGK